jgi:hypothetical protein
MRHSSASIGQDFRCMVGDFALRQDLEDPQQLVAYARAPIQYQWTQLG